jgi:hypothetical protein
MSLIKESDPTLGDRFWLPYTLPSSVDILQWIHSETGQIGNLTWRKGQVKSFPLIIIILYEIQKNPIHNY